MLKMRDTEIGVLRDDEGKYKPNVYYMIHHGKHVMIWNTTHIIINLEAADNKGTMSMINKIAAAFGLDLEMTRDRKTNYPLPVLYGAKPFITADQKIIKLERKDYTALAGKPAEAESVPEVDVTPQEAEALQPVVDEGEAIESPPILEELGDRWKELVAMQPAAGTPEHLEAVTIQFARGYDACRKEGTSHLEMLCVCCGGRAKMYRTETGAALSCYNNCSPVMSVG